MADADSVPEIIPRKEAKTRGLLFYFTGKLCRNGHLAKRYVSCHRCVECADQTSKIWYGRDRSLHRDKIIAKKRRWYWRHRNERLIRAKKYREKHKEAIRQKKLKADKSLKREYASRSYAKNKESILSRLKENYKRNPVSRLTNNRNYKARKRGRGSHSPQDIDVILKAQRGLCAYCRELLTKYHVDHIVPLSKGGSNERTNIQLLCGPCNLHKQARDPLVHARYLGLLI